ncbi:hypothetical protein GCM10023079_11470 [Streptomyces chitinivorans]
MRVARVAAGAVFLAGVSLTAVGTASAVGVDAAVQIGIMSETEGTGNGGGDDGGAANGGGGDGNEISGVNGDPGDPEPSEPEPTDPEPTEPEPTDPEPSEPEPTDPEPTEPEPTDPEPSEPEPTDPEPTDPTTPPAGGTGGSTGGPDTATTGGTGGEGENPNTCILDESTVDCGPDTDSVGTRPISQEKPKEELAETGAAETTFLLVGAATMIAGGIGFRLMPRMVNRNTVA